MKVVITGSRGWIEETKVYEQLDKLLDLVDIEGTGPLEVIEGDARGADRISGLWAKQRISEGRNIVHTCMPAQWNKYGKSAGFIRNGEMLELNPDIVLAFWDGQSRGTKHTIDLATQRGFAVKVIS